MSWRFYFKSLSYFEEQVGGGSTWNRFNNMYLMYCVTCNKRVPPIPCGELPLKLFCSYLPHINVMQAAVENKAFNVKIIWIVKESLSHECKHETDKTMYFTRSFYLWKPGDLQRAYDCYRIIVLSSNDVQCIHYMHMKFKSAAVLNSHNYILTKSSE